jgi:hypothetical protein
MKFLWIGLLVVSSTPALVAQNLIETGGGREHERSSKRTWIRRATLAASCAASLLFDSVSTQRATAAGGVERNGLFAGPQGNPQWGRIISVKAGLCGASAVLQETHVFGAWQSRNADWTWTGVNLATTSAYTWAGVHNLGVANSK